MLLPGYVNQTLSPQEDQKVATHLGMCVTCQKELQEVTQMQTAIQASIEDRPGPSPAAFATLMQRIEQEKQVSLQQTSETRGMSWWATVESTCRSLFEVKWVPALASVLIVGQAFLLFSLTQTPEGQRGQMTGPIIKRGIPQGTPPVPQMQIQVKFSATATEIQIRDLLKKLSGQIVNGPTNEDLYTLEFSQTEISASSTPLAALQAHPELIKTATLRHP